MASKVLSVAGVLGVGLLGFFACGSEVDEANRLFVLENYEGAIQIYEKVAPVESQKESEEAFFGMGRAYQMLGQWGSAKDCFVRLLRAHPRSELVPGTRIQIGQCEVKLGNPRGALLIFEEIEKTYPGEQTAVEAMYNISNLKAGFFGDDVKNARAAINAYHRVLGSTHAGRYVVQSHFGLGQCYMLLRDYPRAIGEFQAVLEKGPDTVWAAYARDQIFRAMRAFGNGRALGMLRKQQELWADFQQEFWRPFYGKERFAWRFPASRPVLRIHAVGFFTESQKAGPGREKVIYLTPTIRYRNYVFSSERGTVDRANRLVSCVGNVRCTDGLVPPRLMVTSGTLTLDTGKSRAIFSGDVQLEKRSAADVVQKVVAGELHLLLDSGNIEIPAKQ